MGAQRIEVAHTQYYGWALRNRAALLPSREQARAAHEAIGQARERHSEHIAIDYVAPDYLGRYPKPCMNGWGQRSMNVAPDGTALPCHAAATIPGLVFWNVRQRPLAEIWQASPAFEAYRGTDWMRKPCVSCPRRETDFGGCRCQALAITGDARNTDPVCHLSEHRHLIDAMLSEPAQPILQRGHP
ncbi:SPASM domain-containing protein [Enterovirga rhinocerotis]|uniref:SPASM domain-containing protein n=1 Tax=Enterovirga rhinocerotis TaxID=1339210 RepID=UPI001FE06AF0|nr:SPASM domain-containing protein [Enterovirga rhinocerotis]